MKILIIKTSALGDIAQSFMAVEYLRKAYPEAEIGWVVEAFAAKFVAANRAVDYVIPFDSKMWRQKIFSAQTYKSFRSFIKEIRARKYDMVFDLQANLKSGLILALTKSARKIGFGIKSVHEWPNLLFTNYKLNPPAKLNIRDDYLFVVKKSIQKEISWAPTSCLEMDLKEQQLHDIECQKIDQRKKIKIMVCIGSRWATKQLSQETILNFLKTVDSQLSVSFLFIWATDEEKELCQELLNKQFSAAQMLESRVSLSVLQNMMLKFDLVFAMDSLPLHLAATTNVATYSVFGSSLADKFKPQGPNHGAFQGTCPYGKTFAKRCPILRSCKTGSCIKDITGQVLFADFLQWLEKLKKWRIDN